MKRLLTSTTAFGKRLAKWQKRRPELGGTIQAVLAQLAEDAFAPSLKTHKLRGDMKGKLSCSAGYDLRIIFEIRERVSAKEDEETEEVVLLSLGTHDALY